MLRRSFPPSTLSPRNGGTSSRNLLFLGKQQQQQGGVGASKGCPPLQRLLFLLSACFVFSVYSGYKYIPSASSVLADGLDAAADSIEKSVAGVVPAAASVVRKVEQKQEAQAPVTASTTTTQQQQQQQGAQFIQDNPAPKLRTNSNPKEDDKDCIFRDSPLYRKVFVYPNPGEPGWEGDLLTESGRNRTAMQWPWLAIDHKARQDAQGHYDIDSQIVQYTTELLVRELMVNPKSCLRTYNPEEATLFYVPYLPSTEHHVGHRAKTDYSTSPYGQAIMDILNDQSYDAWERLFGMTSQYWKRRNGSDHILVFSEPMHGLYHPRNKRGNFHFVHSQKQLKPPIVISVELSTTFVQEYPHCSAKNILVPYPNTHGNFFNGVFAQQAQQLLLQSNVTVDTSSVVLPAERELYQQYINNKNANENALLQPPPPRPVAQYYQAGLHGTCTKLRKAMKADYQSCAPSHHVLSRILERSHFSTAMRVVTFCPCPGGDSPSAKRHFDALIAGCIPIILSSDFVWPFTKEFDPFSLDLDPNDFSLRLTASDFDDPLLDSKTCQPNDPSKPGLQALLESIPAKEIARLRRGVAAAGRLYSWYAHDDPDLPENPLREGVLPNGGTAHWVVQALAERAEGKKWPACEEELQQPHGPDSRQFKC